MNKDITTVVYEQELWDYKGWLKPLKARSEVGFTPDLVGKLPALTELITNSTDRSIAVIPIWLKEAEKLGFTVNLKMVGSWYDPSRIAINTALRLSRYLLNKWGEAKYKQVFNLK